MEIIGILKQKSDKQQISEAFSVQKFYLDNVKFNNSTGETYSNILRFQAVNEKINLLDNLQKGERIKVYFDIRGSVYDKEDGKKGHAQNLNVWKIEPVNTTNQPTPQDPQIETTTNSEEDLPF